MLTRRHVLRTGGGLLLAASVAPRSLVASEVVEISMQGNADGSKVWFDPIGVLVQPGQTIRWANRDLGNAHTTTAYHPKNFEHPRRIPEGAEPWNSDYLLPNETFSVTLTVEGVYDYFCIPHEHAGMVGRIVVGHPDNASAAPSREAAPEGGAPSVPEPAQRAFPAVDEIMRRKVVRRT
jgi:plastocyanin